MTEFGERGEVQISLYDEEWYVLMKMAHQRDITLNQLVGEILAQEIERVEQEQSHDHT